jgi:Ca2+-binding EF-hand superfamily protein
MDLKSLRSLLDQSFPGVELDGLATCIWRIYDTDLDGKISFREFLIALNTMKTGSAEENLRLIYRLFDVNSDGCVEKEELERVAKELSKLGEVSEGTTQRAFIEIDTDMDGCLSLQEFVEAGLQQKVAATSLIVKVIDIFVSE